MPSTFAILLSVFFALALACFTKESPLTSHPHTVTHSLIHSGDETNAAISLCRSVVAAAFSSVAVSVRSFVRSLRN